MKQVILINCLLLIMILTSSAQKIEKEYINPGPGYTQVVTATANGVKTIYVSGQVGEGKSLEEQTRSALLNVKKQLEQAGASFADVVKMNWYIVKYEEKDLDVFRGVRKEIMGETNMPASTLVGVYSLFRKEYLIEIEAIAILKE
ncbi:MAG: RidA family protein [Cyclobacteriaceae bacterium]|nr:MAG: RidA family protein [Cyclobacteriaceae bacterium]